MNIKMKMKFKKMSLLAVIVFATIFFIGNALAQETTTNSSGDGDNNELIKINDNAWQPAENITGVDCFDYYKFQSVQVSVGAEKDEYDQGEKIIFKGNLLNENDYPVVDGNVFVRISKTGEDIAVGNDVVDEFIALQNVNLKAQESKDVEFSWGIPNQIISGNYQADFFFSVGKKFNLGGLPFSNEIIVGMSDFKINSNDETGILFDRIETKVNGEKYYHIGDWPVVEKDSKVSITQPIKNISDKDEKIKIRYDLYFWDSLNEKDKIDSKAEEMVVLANSKKTLEYVIPKMNRSVYYLKITATTAGGQQAIVNIRVASQQDGIRLNYPAITKFPLNKGDKVILFTCFHNTSGTVPTGKIIVSLKDKNGKDIGKLKYEGKISGAMLADKIDIDAKKDYDYIKLHAVAYDNGGKIVDEYETVYDCKDFDNCKIDNKNIINEVKNTSFIKLVGVLIALVIILPIIVIVIVVTKNKKKNNI